MSRIVETTGQIDMGLSPALTADQDSNDSQESLGVVVEVMNDCLDPFGGGNDEGTEVVEVAEVAETAILGDFDDDDMLINTPSQAAASSETPYNSGEMNVIV